MSRYSLLVPDPVLDSVHSSIDRAYDTAERMVDGLGQLLGVDVTTKPSIIDVKDSTAATRLPAKQAIALPAGPSDPVPTSSKSPTPPTPQFTIVTSADRRGRMIWTVTNGLVHAECTSLAFAEQVLAAIRKGLGQ